MSPKFARLQRASVGIWLAALLAASACGNAPIEAPPGSAGTSGGAQSSGGKSGTGGSQNQSGAPGTGGSAVSGGTSTGGSGQTGGAGGNAAGASAGGAVSGGTGGSGGSAGTTPSSGGSSANGGSGGTGTSGGSGGALPGSCSGDCAIAPTGSCSAPEVRITEVNLGSALSYGTSETDVLPLAIAALPGGGSRIAWMTGFSRNGSSRESLVHVATLDCNDVIVGTPFTFAAYDFQDLAADAEGGVIVLTRDADGGDEQHCGDVNNLCILPSDRPGCYDMFMVRHDCAGNELWAAELTTATAESPPYSAGDGTNYAVWWYQHHGRIAYDGTNYAAYFCDAITVTNDQCVNGAGKVDIHQGDRMQVVDPTGNLLSGRGSFGIGCSHSGFTRIVWDPALEEFVMVCKTDNDNRIAQPNPYRTVLPVELDGSYVGDLVLDRESGYWLTVSNEGSVLLLHFENGEPADEPIVLAEANYPHLAAYGENHILAAWATSATGNMTAQVRDSSTGAAVGDPFPIAVPGHPYQSFMAFPDGSVAYAAVGASSSTIQIARVLPCE